MQYAAEDESMAKREKKTELVVRLHVYSDHFFFFVFVFFYFFCFFFLRCCWRFFFYLTSRTDVI